MAASLGSTALARAIGKRSRSSRRDVAAGLVARALSHGLGSPLGKPRRSLAYAYFGGGVPRQPTEVTSLVVRTRHVGLTAAVITAFNIVSCSWLGKEHVEFH